MSQQTVPVETAQASDGYWINSGLSGPTATAVAGVQARLQERFPGAVWSIPRSALHCTLLGWIDPVRPYPVNKTTLFTQIEPSFSTAFRQCIANQPPIAVTFDTVAAFPAAVIIRGHDNGSYERIRQQFAERVTLPEGTDPPPKIIHATIAKFTQQIDLDEVSEFLRTQPFMATELVKQFRLVHETELFMMQYDVLRRFDVHTD